MIVQAQNLLNTVSQHTYLTQTEGAGTTTLHVKNVNGFSSQWALQLGKTGEEQTEITVLAAGAPSGTSLTAATATVYEHPSDTPVYAVKYNKIIFKVSTTGTAGTATAITSGTVNITPDSDTTNFDHTTGLSTYAYKTSYYNSVLDSESSNSDWLTPAGYDFYSLAKIRQRTKDKLISAGYLGDDDIVDDWINEWLETMTNTAIDVNEDYNMGTVDVSFSGTAELGTITSSDFKQLRRVWHTNDGVNWYNATKMNLTGYDPNQTFNSTYPFFYMQGDTVIGRQPHDTGGTLRVSYYKLNTILTNETDTLPVTMKGYTKSFVDYSLAQAYYKDGKTNEGLACENKANAGLERFKKELTPRHKTGTTFIKIMESVGEDDWW